LSAFLFIKSQIDARENPVNNYLDVVLHHENALEAPLVFRKPTLTDLCVTVTRLIRFEAPPRHPVIHLKRFLQHCLISTPASKKSFHLLKTVCLEAISQALWHFTLDSSEWDLPNVQDDQLSLLLVLEKLSEFSPALFLEADLLLQETCQSNTLHSAYYQQDLTRERAIEILEKQHYRTDFLQKLPPEQWQTGYVLCQQLNTILPWTAFLESCSPTLLSRFPEVQRLKCLKEQLAGQVEMMPSVSLKTTSFFNGNGMAFKKSSILFETLKEWQHSILNATNNASYPSEIPGTILPDQTATATRPVRQMVLVEGETEKLLLPLHAMLLSHSFNTLGILLCPVGGKSNMMAYYQNYANGFMGNLYVLLDNDARDIVQALRQHQRPNDCISIIDAGEFEDLYHLAVVQTVINTVFQPYPAVTPELLATIQVKYKTTGMVQLLKALWIELKLGSFDKILFARQYAETLQNNLKGIQDNPSQWISTTMIALIEEVVSLKQTA
jgi:hypothetical protein